MFRLRSAQNGMASKVLGRFKILDVLARSGSLYYVQVVCTKFRLFKHSSQERSKNEFGVTGV